MFIQPDWWDVTKPGVGTNRNGYAGGIRWMGAIRGASGDADP